METLRKIPGFLREFRKLKDPYEQARFALNRLLHHLLGGNGRAAFFDLATTCPRLLSLDRNFELIRAEATALLDSQAEIPDYHEIDRRQHYLSAQGDPARHWRVFALKAIAGEPVENQRRCPGTTALLDAIPHVTTAFFSILTPGKSIPAHEGPYVGRLRYHLALVVPEHNPPRMRVKDEVVTWQTGRSFLFDDSLEHEIYNESDSVRVVLVVDVMRPLPWPFNWLNAFCWRVIFRNSPRWREVLRRARTYGPMD